MGQVRERVIARGQKFEVLKGYHYEAYDGVAILAGASRVLLSALLILV
jgi:hypothetical protein